MINFDNYCYNYFNNKFNVPFIDTRLQTEFSILYNKIVNSQLQFKNITDRTFNKYLPNLTIETGRLFNKIMIFADFEHSTSIKSKILKTIHSIYNYYKNFEPTDQLLYSFYNNYSTSYYNIANVTCHSSNEISICNLLLEELFVNIFKDFLNNLKTEVVKNSLDVSISLSLNKQLLCSLITQNLIIQNTTVNIQLENTILNLLSSDLDLINTYINSKLLVINKKTIANLIQDEIQSYLLYNLITTTNIIKPIEIDIEQKDIQNSIVAHYLQANNNIIESFQFIAAQFKMDPLLFINSLKISHSYLVDLLYLSYQYDFTNFRDITNTTNINQVNINILKDFINNKDNYLFHIDTVIKHAVQNYLIIYIDSLLNDSYVSNIIINNILPKLSKYSVQAIKFKFPITQYIKLLYTKSMYQMNFEDSVADYVTVINNYDLNITIDHINDTMSKTIKSLYLDKYNQASKLKNFYMSTIADTIANSFIDRYRV